MIFFFFQAEDAIGGKATGLELRRVLFRSAHFYVRFVEDTLKNEEARYFSRILILLMQNDIQASGLDYDAARLLRNLSCSKSYSPAPLYSFSGILLEFFRDIGSRIFKLSFKNEKRWLSFRMK